MALHNIEFHTQERHRCSIVGLWAPDPGRLAWFLWSVLTLPSNLADSVVLDPQSSGGRLRSFLLDEGVQLVQFGNLGFLGHFCRRQLADVISHPVDDSSMVNVHDPSDGLFAFPLQVQTIGQHVRFFRVSD